MERYESAALHGRPFRLPSLPSDRALGNHRAWNGLNSGKLPDKRLQWMEEYSAVTGDT